MVSLLDIANAPRTVNVRGVDVPVFGISAVGLALLMQRFPEIRALFAGREINLDANAIFEIVPRAVHAIIAAGCGCAGNGDAEKVAAGLALYDQMELLTTILDMTMPSGLSPLVASLERLTAGLGVQGVGSKEADLKSPQP